MKKLLAVLLSLITIFSAFTLSASALDLGDLGDLTGGLLGGEEEGGTNQIEYKKDTLDEVTLFYQAGNTLLIGDSKYTQITEDTPIALDHDFICWVDKAGNRYYPGDIIKVEGTVTLYAVWEEKQDNDSYMVRVVKASVQALMRIVKLVLGVMDTAKEFDDAYWESKYNEQNGITDGSTDVPETETVTDVTEAA